MNRTAALRPLADAAGAIRRLGEQDDTAELAAAVEQVGAAVERSLRVLLRGDRSAPDEHRLSALSQSTVPLDSVVQSLRSRDRISLELAGTIHELGRAVARAREGQTRAADAELAQRAVARLAADLAALEPADGPEVGAGDTEWASPDRTGEAEPDEAGLPAAAGDAGYPPSRGRWLAWLGAAVAAVFVAGLAWMVVRGGGGDYDRAVAAFRAGRLDSAAVAFRQVLADHPANTSAMLYLARIHRRQGEPSAAADLLRDAVARAPRDPQVRRELGHLFMDLGRPRSAIEQYERALEHDPDHALNWAGLIRALRAAGDPRSEQLLRDAPPDVRAIFDATDAPGS